MLFQLTPAKIGLQAYLTLRLGEAVVGWVLEDPFGSGTVHQRWRFSLAPDPNAVAERADTLDELLGKVSSMLSAEVRP